MQTANARLEIPEDLRCKWQKLTNVVANTLAVSAIVIKQRHSSGFRVIAASQVSGHLFKNNLYGLEQGFHCDRVVQSRTTVVASTAKPDSLGASSPGNFLKDDFYLGHPLFWPDKELFGVFSAVGGNVRKNKSGYEELLIFFKEQVESHLQALALDQELNAENFRRQWAEEKLRETAGNFKAIINNAMDGIVTIDEKGTIQSFNPAAENIFGYREKEMVGQNAASLMPERYKREHGGYSGNYLETGQSKVMGQPRVVPAVRKDGREIPIEISVSQMMFDEKRVFIGIIRDFSRRKKAEEEARRYIHELEKANADLQAFAFMSSHDLKEPLRKISIFSDRLKDSSLEKLNDKEKDYLDRMQRAAFRMHDLIENLMRYAHLTSNNMEKEKVDLNLAVLAALDDLEIELKETQCLVETGDLPSVYSNFHEMRELFQNLISNAVKYARPGTTPGVSIRWNPANKNHWEIQIKDNGLGMEEKYIKDIFKPCKRLNSDAAISGSGMGLFICKTIMDRCQGEIEVQTKLQQGSTFSLLFPKTSKC